MALRSPTGDMGGTLALDTSALNALRQHAKTAPAEALSKAAGQFEALFLQMVLKSMRDALPQDGPLASDSAKAYTSMLDQQLAQKLAERGVGLRKALERQLARALPGGAAPDPATNAAPTTFPGPGAAPAPAAMPMPSGLAIPPVKAPTAFRIRTEPPPAPSAPPAATEPAHPATEPSRPTGAGMLPQAVQDFIDKFRAHAETAAKAIGVPAALLLAQAGLETGWGRSQPRTADGATSHNLFGIKAGSRWAGGVAVASTTEHVQGRAVRTTERFRAYGSDAESFQDFARLLRDNPRYSAALANAQDPQTYAASLQRAGYATDPAYADKLTRAIQLVTRHTGGTAPATPQVMAAAADIQKDRT